jgi:hypothetical protein
VRFGGEKREGGGVLISGLAWARGLGFGRGLRPDDIGRHRDRAGLVGAGKMLLGGPHLSAAGRQCSVPLRACR